MKRHLGALIVLVGLLTIVGSRPAHAQFPGPMGPTMYSSNCANSPQFGYAQVCWDTTNQYPYYWSSTAFVPAANNVTVAKLPTCGASQLGLQQIVTDSTTISAEGQTCAGTSTHKALAICLDGSTWKCF